MNLYISWGLRKETLFVTWFYIIVEFWHSISSHTSYGHHIEAVHPWLMRLIHTYLYIVLSPFFKAYNNSYKHTHPHIMLCASSINSYTCQENNNQHHNTAQESLHIQWQIIVITYWIVTKSQFGEDVKPTNHNGGCCKSRTFARVMLIIICQIQKCTIVPRNGERIAQKKPKPRLQVLNRWANF